MGQLSNGFTRSHMITNISLTTLCLVTLLSMFCVKVHWSTSEELVVRIVSGSSTLPWQQYLNICSVVYGSRKSLNLDEFFRPRSNVHLFVRSGMPPRPLSQIMWFYRQLEPILRGVLAGEIVLPTSLKEAREIRPYNRGVRLDGQSMRSLVSGQAAASYFLSEDVVERDIIPMVVDVPIHNAIYAIGQ